MCRACDVETGPGWGELWETSLRDEKAFEKRSQTALIERLVHGTRLQVKSLDGNDTFVLSTPTGRSEVVYGVRHLWSAVSSLSGKAVDVLDRDWLRQIEETYG